ncbi:metallophosphatase [Haloprofundus marisrubri]|uniref:DNA double-strand break repair protein Mre11 n=1 Tax=Haloprofundus marisrubri TaxID=1514971 RepID=A0A0W1R919_9EURY|nr:DNA double-strand break repair protein Mre11 [Haloprofundus marisrubri]KTG09806.1 metallophosphatase [Haloprofundus marisrubri]
MTRVIHTGDTHIGYQQYHSPARRQDFLTAFEQVLDDAIDDDVDAVVHAGDLFHDRRPELQDLLGTLSALRTLQSADIPFLAVVGNHESTRGGQWLDLFERLGLAARLGPEPHVVGDTAFYGLDHVPKSRRDDLDYRFEPHDADHSALVSHGLFTPFAHADWETETVLSESNVDFDVVLLGDNHEAGTADVSGTPVTYCGSTERASTSEEEGRGYNIVSFADDGDGRTVDIRQRALETRSFVFVSVDLNDGEGEARVREQVRQHDLEDAVVVVEVTGDGDPVTPASIEEFVAERGALVVRVTDRRELDVDTEISVSFADPDDAVRERISDLGLSAAAIDVDETVRASKTADSNVRDEVKERVSTLVEDGLDNFERAEARESDRTEEPDNAATNTETGGVSSTTETVHANTGVSESAASGDPASNGTKADPVSASAATPEDDESTDSAEAAGTTDTTEATEATEDETADESAKTDESTAADESATATESNSSTDGQLSMEDYS